MTPRSISLRQIALIEVRVDHGYYNGSGGRCPDLTAVPTPETAALMQQLRLAVRDTGAGFIVTIDQAALPALRGFIAGRAAGSATMPPSWTWLSFRLMLGNPALVGLTALPITTNPLAQNLYASNLVTSGAGDALRFGKAAKGKPAVIGSESLSPVVGSTLRVAARPGLAPVLLDIAGSPVPSATVSGTAAAATIDVSQTPQGRYQVGWRNAAGDVVADPAPGDWFLHLPDVPPVSLGMIDLLMAQPGPKQGNAAAFPMPWSARGVAGDAPVAPVTLTLGLQPRATFWQYYVVPHGKAGQFDDDLAITGTATGFRKSSQVLPNGDHAVLFTATKPLAMQQRSTHRFRLSGARRHASGARDTISVDWLPAPPPTPVWPGPAANDLTGRSEIYVYV